MTSESDSFGIKLISKLSVCVCGVCVGGGGRGDGGVGWLCVGVRGESHFKFPR